MRESERKRQRNRDREREAERVRDRDIYTERVQLLHFNGYIFFVNKL